MIFLFKVRKVFFAFSVIASSNQVNFICPHSKSIADYSNLLYLIYILTFSTKTGIISVELDFFYSRLNLSKLVFLDILHA